MVEKRLGTAAYLLVVDLDDMSFEAVAGPSPSAGPGAGIEAVSIVLNMGGKSDSIRIYFSVYCQHT